MSLKQKYLCKQVRHNNTMHPLLYFLFFLLLSCNTATTKVAPIDMPVGKSDTFAPHKYPDTLRNLLDRSYLADLPLKKVASLILSDSVLPMDDDITFNCLDSALSGSKATRDFYLPVFKKIIDKSDGALSEVTGRYIMDYAENYPAEFAMIIKQLTKDQLENWSFLASYELGFVYDGNTKMALGWIKDILKKCKHCGSDEISHLNTFVQRSVASMKTHPND